MYNQADEDRKELALIDAQIKDAQEKLARKREGAAALEAFIDQKTARRWVVEARLAREEAVYRKPQPVGVKAGCYDI